MARFPALFLGHGNPMNAIQPSEHTRAWERIAGELPRPKAILCVSAHWYVAGARVSAEERPRTIHDFGGFPRALCQVQPRYCQALVKYRKIVMQRSALLKRVRDKPLSVR